MKKKSLRNLQLRKNTISNFKVTGGRAAGESRFNTVCPECETEDCPPKNPVR